MKACPVVEAITTVRAVMAVGAGGHDPLVLENGTVELVFGITDEGTISVGVDGELTEGITNTLKIRLVGAELRAEMALQHRELMAEREDLNVFVPIAHG